jgi:hypothetical protein
MQQNTVYRPFVPLLMLAASVAVWLGFSTLQLMQERDDLRNAGEKQQLLVDQSTKLRSQMAAIGEQLATLRDQGNVGATEILRQLDQSNIKLDHRISVTANATDSAPAAPE